MKNLKLAVIVFVSIFAGFFSAVSFAQKQGASSKSIKNKYSEDLLSQVLERVKKDYVDEKTQDQLI